MKKVGVFCAASQKLDISFYEEARAVGQWLGREGWHLVYGGANSGLMEAVAQGVHEAGGRITGVVPRILESKRKASSYLDELVPCENLTERKQIMMDISDVFLVLPGGVGTLDELFTVMASDSIGYHAKPVVLYNASGFWDSLIRLLEEFERNGFMNTPYTSYLRVTSSQEDLKQLLAY